MLDNLMNPDLSGVSGYIHYTYDNSIEIMPAAIIALAAIAFVIGFLMICFRCVNGSASKRYRELLSDMYVVGKIKQIATEDKVDLISELKRFESIMKKSKNDLKSIDSVVEMELKENISERNDKQKQKPSKE